MTSFVAEQILEKKTELTQELTTTNKDNLSLKNELESLKTQIHSSDATLSVELENSRKKYLFIQTILSNLNKTLQEIKSNIKKNDKDDVDMKIINSFHLPADFDTYFPNHDKENLQQISEAISQLHDNVLFVKTDYFTDVRNKLSVKQGELSHLEAKCEVNDAEVEKLNKTMKKLENQHTSSMSNMKESYEKTIKDLRVQLEKKEKQVTDSCNMEMSSVKKLGELENKVLNLASKNEQFEEEKKVFLQDVRKLASSHDVIVSMIIIFIVLVLGKLMDLK